MTHLIRPATISDAFALADLLREIGYFSWINDQPLEVIRDRVSSHLSMCLSDNSHTVYVACFEDNLACILGYVSVHWLPYLLASGPDGYVSELFIRPLARGQGIGSALLDAAISEARRRGCNRMRLLNMRHRESYLRGFYKKHGWEEQEDAATFQLSL